MKKICIVAISLLALFCLATPPAGWLTNPQQAQKLSRARKLPVLIIFTGESDSETSLLKAKLEKLKFVIEEKCIPLYVELPPASTWRRSFKYTLQATYPFLTLDSGIPLPALYVTDSNFTDLEIPEPRYTAPGFQKMLEDAQDKFSGKTSAVQTSPVLPEDPAPQTNPLDKKLPSSQTVSLQQTKKQYTSAMQAAEAARQKLGNSDPTGDPPRNWFTDPAKAKEFAAARKLPILMLFSGTDWCGPCKYLRSNVLDKSDVCRLIVEKCVALYIHVPRGGWNQIRLKYPFWRAKGVPSFLFTDANFNVIPGISIRERSYRGIDKAIKAATKSLK